MRIVLLVIAGGAALFASCSTIDLKPTDLTSAEKNAILEGLTNNAEETNE